MDALLLFLIVLMFSVRFSPVQSFLAEKLVNTYFKDCNTLFAVNYLDTDFYQTIRLKELSIEDTNGADIISVNELRIDFTSLLNLTNDLSFENIKLIDPKFNIKVYEGDSISNFTQWLSCFPKSSSEKKLELSFNNIQIKNGQFLYINENKLDSKPLGHVNFNDIFLTDLNLSSREVKIHGDSTFASLEQLYFQDKSGFKVGDFSTNQLQITSSYIKSQSLKLTTNQSSLDFTELNFEYNSFESFSSFNDSVALRADINSSVLDLKDLSYFYQPFDSINEKYYINTKVDGKVSELFLGDVTIRKQNENTFTFKGDAQITGLPDVNNSFFNVNSNQLVFDKSSIENFELLKLAKIKNLALPNNLNSLGEINASGSFRGYLQGFMTEFKANNDLGKLDADLNFYYDSYENQMVYDGNISTPSFNVGKLYDIKEIGKVVGSANVNAKGLKIDDLRTEIKSDITSLELNKYSYKNISLNGVLEKNLFEGIASVKDKNLVAKYDGEINFNDKIPHFDFDLNLEKLNLKPLNVHTKESTLSLNLTLKGEATSIDDLDGDLRIDELLYSQEGQNYFLDSIVLNTDQISKNKNIELKSELLDANLSGDFKLTHIPDIFYSMLAEVMPKKIKPKDISNISENENLKFVFNLKDISAVTKLFYPDLEISKNAILSGEYNSKLDFFDFKSDIEYVNYNGILLKKINLETYLSEVYEVQLHIDTVSHMDVIVPNVNIFSAIYDDNFGIQASWDGNKLNGDINGNGYWDELGYFHFDLIKTNVSTPQQKWHLKDRASLNEIDSLTFKLSELVFLNENQNIRLKGLIGPKPKDILNVAIDSVSLNDILPITSVNIEGALTANLNIMSILSNPKYSGNLYSNVIIDGSELGEIELKTKRNRFANEKIAFIGMFKQNDKDVIGLNGGYDFQKPDSALNISLNFKELQIEPIHPFLPSTISDLRSELSGKIKLTGSLDSPDFNGKLNLSNGHIKIKELNTDYTFDGDLIIEPDLIYAENTHTYDKFGSKATVLSASYFHDYFKEYSYEFSVHMPESFLALNTTYEDNSMFYGKAFATGFVNISYDKYNLLEIDVEAKSEKQTNITLPLYGAEEVSIGNFVSFVNFSDSTQTVDNELNLSGITMNFNFLATPDAQLNLVFDDVVGDRITAFGNGNIFMEIDQYDHFKMYGQYELDHGEYLFTLKNVVNKKFDLAKGGTMSWYGDPYNAEIDVDAVYNLKASVADLFPVEEQSNYRTKQVVDCYLNLSNNLFSPSLGFEIQLPKAPENIQSALKSTINTQEELNRQFFSLLLLNKFLPRQSSTIGSIGTGVSTSTSEVLTNQLSQILDQWWEGVDVGLNYESGNGLSSDEYAVALSTQIFNEKLSLSGNFGVAQDNSTDNSNLIGDVSVEYILDKNGTFKLRAFNESNSYDPTRSFQGNYTQGVGVSYQKSFNTWNELLLWNKFKQLFNK